MRSNFIDKVYDTYISSDFSYGDDNLNPQREIDLSDTKSVDDKIAEIYAELNKRVVAVKKTVEDITGESENDIYHGNAAPETLNGVDDSKLKNIIGLTGSSGDKIVVVPYFDDDNDPITLELELMLLEKTLQAYFPNGPQEPGSSNTNPGGFLDTDLPPFAPDCTIFSADGQGTEISGGGDVTSGSSNSSGNGNTDDRNGGDVNADAPTVDAAKLADAIDDALNSLEKRSTQNEKDQAACAKAEIGILKMILAVLKVIKMIRQMMDPAFTIIMQAIKIVQLAAQCWNNPTCIGVIIQRVLGTVIAILMGVVAELIAQIWKMLGMDCFSAQVQQIMDEIREALAAIGNVFSELDVSGIVTDIKDMVGSVQDTWDTVSGNVAGLTSSIGSMKETAKAALKSSLQAAFPGFTDAQFKDFISNKRYRERLLGTLRKTAPGLVDSIEEGVNAVLTVPDTVVEVTNQIRKITGSLSAEKQLMATLENLQSF